jgi:hypothetical protein
VRAGGVGRRRLVEYTWGASSRRREGEAVRGRARRDMARKMGSDEGEKSSGRRGGNRERVSPWMDGYPFGFMTRYILYALQVNILSLAQHTNPVAFLWTIKPLEKGVSLSHALDLRLACTTLPLPSCPPLPSLSSLPPPFLSLHAQRMSSQFVKLSIFGTVRSSLSSTSSCLRPPELVERRKTKLNARLSLSTSLAL